MKIVPVFEKEYSADKEAEGMAVMECVLIGSCNSCIHLERCESDDDTFVFPAGAACMVRKAELLRRATQAGEDVDD